MQLELKCIKSHSVAIAPLRAHYFEIALFRRFPDFSLLDLTKPNVLGGPNGYSEDAELAFGRLFAPLEYYKILQDGLLPHVPGTWTSPACTSIPERPWRLLYWLTNWMPDRSAITWSAARSGSNAHQRFQDHQGAEISDRR